MEMSINGAKILATFENVPILGTVHVTQTLVVSWLVMIIISALCIWLGSNLKVTNISRKQAAAETIYNALVNFVHDKMGTGFDRYIPLVGTIFITSIVSNLISLLGIWSPTADLMTELGWALVVFVLITYHKIKASGIGGYLKGFLDPIFVMAPINVMSELFTPISMACRHFGNILSGTVINALIYGALALASHALFGLLPGLLGDVLSQIPFLDVGLPAITSIYFDWFSGAMQAFIFCMLTTMYIANAAEAD